MWLLPGHGLLRRVLRHVSSQLVLLSVGLPYLAARLYVCVCTRHFDSTGMYTGKHLRRWSSYLVLGLWLWQFEDASQLAVEDEFDMRIWIYDKHDRCLFLRWLGLLFTLATSDRWQARPKVNLLDNDGLKSPPLYRLALYLTPFSNDWYLVHLRVQ